MQHLCISYNTQLCLKSKHTSKCVGLETSTQTLSANYPPAYIQVKDQIQTQRPQYTLRLKVILRDLQKSQFIIEGSKVHLINVYTDEYVTCSSGGQVKFDKRSTISEEVNKHLYKASTWTVQFLRNQTKVIQNDKELITVYDDLCFKSVHGSYLTIKFGSLQLCASSQVDATKSVWNLIRANVPHIPQWVFTRPAFNKFSKFTLPGSQGNKITQTEVLRQKKLLKSFPPEMQQQLLVQDILDVMLGFDGVYIKKHKNLTQFVIQPHLQQPSCNIALRQLVEKILALPSIYYRIQTYIATYSIQQGIICQALCGGLRQMVKQYKTMVTQLDELVAQQGLTLQRLWYTCQGVMVVMQSLWSLIAQAQDKRGGQLITVLTKLLNQNTDEKIMSVYNFLFGGIMQVYVQMMSKWLYQGIIEDKFGQFMIMVEEKRINQQWNYWEQKFVIRQEMVPSIFSKQANQILVTGKYLNILKTCKKLEQHPHRKQIYIHFQRYISIQNFSEPILKAYEWTNSKMLQLVFVDSKLNQVLKSVKGYFFLQFGDLFVHFMDAAEEDLSLPKKKTANEGFKTKVFSQQKMQNLFQLLIRTSSANNDPFKEQVTCRVQNTSIYEQMHRIKTLQPQKLDFDFSEKPFVKRESKYVDYLTIQYKCQFPLTLIFNKKSMSKYQLLFRLLFWCKFVQRQLNSVWLSLQQTKQIPMPFYTPAYLLNQRMINFIKNFIYYLCYEVIEQNWLVFTQNLKKVKTFQDIIECHSDFLNSCLKQSLLSNSRLLTLITSQIGKTCDSFTVVKKLIEQLLHQFHFEATPTIPKTGSIISQRKVYIEGIRQHIQDSLEEKDFRAIVEGYGVAFDDAMRKLLRQIYQMIGKQQNHLLNLVNRLDEEKFYNKRLFGTNQQLSADI